jgi:hypothetical protein
MTRRGHTSLWIISDITGTRLYRCGYSFAIGGLYRVLIANNKQVVRVRQTAGHARPVFFRRSTSFAAALLGQRTLIQSPLGPDRNGELIFFDTLPSSPTRQGARTRRHRML